MEKNKYNWLTRLINKITRKEESNNQSFVYYGHLVHVQSGTVDFMDVTVATQPMAVTCWLAFLLTSGQRNWRLTNANMTKSET